MTINRIKDLDKFFKMIDGCHGNVSVVSPEGDHIVITSKLSQFVLTALYGSSNELLCELEVKAELKEDTERILNFLMNQ